MNTKIFAFGIIATLVCMNSENGWSSALDTQPYHQDQSLHLDMDLQSYQYEQFNQDVHDTVYDAVRNLNIEEQDLTYLIEKMREYNIDTSCLRSMAEGIKDTLRPNRQEIIEINNFLNNALILPVSERLTNPH